MAEIVVNGLENWFNEDVRFYDDVYFFKDITFLNLNVSGNLTVDGNSLFKGPTTFEEDALFKKDVTILGELEISFLTVKTRLDVGVGGTTLNVDTRTDNVGVKTTIPLQRVQINSEEQNTVVITEEGRVGIGKTLPEDGISGLNTATQGELKLDIDGSVSISRNIYDSAEAPGVNGSYLHRDAYGIRWVEVTPEFTEGIYVEDEGVLIPSPGLAQSFTTFNFKQINSLGLGTDTIIPIPNPDNPTYIADIQSQDLWGYTVSGDIYRMTNVGINQNNPAFALDVNGTLNVNGATTLNSTLDVDLATTLNNTLDVDLATTLNNTLDVDGATTLNNTLDVDGATTLNSTLDVDLATTLNNTLDVDLATTLNNTLDVDGATTLNNTLDVDGATTLNNTLDVDLSSVFHGSVELDSTLIDINQQTGVAGKDYRLASVGTGVSWRPPGVQTQKTIWVTKDGDDSNSGLLEGDAKATVGAAASIAQPYDTIKIRPGRYIENNPIGLRENVSVTGEDLRLVAIQPSNVNSDVFWVRRGCLIENLNFSGSSVGVEHTGCGAVAFPKTDINAASGFTDPGPADEGADLPPRWRSPYIRNCTNFMTKSIGMKIDGNDATASIAGADLKSMVCDSFTQYNENGIGVSITNNAYAQLVSIFTINCDIAIYCDTGGSCDLTNSNSSFGNYGLYAVGLGATEYTGTVLTDVIPGDNSDIVVGNGVTDANNVAQRPYDGQAVYFKIDLDNYPDAVGSGRLTSPLRRVARIDIIDGANVSGFSAASPPPVVIRDRSDLSIQPKGPQGIIAEATATVGLDGNIEEFNLINSGRNYLPTQDLEVDVAGNTGIATVVTEPIYYTVSEATVVTSSGITTITFNEFIDYQLYANDPMTFQRISRILTSSHSFEYVGSGTSINTALPFRGALPIKENEVVALEGAQVPFTSTDQKGNFDIGEGIQVDQTTSTIRGRDFSKAIQAEVTPLILALR